MTASTSLTVQLGDRSYPIHLVQEDLAPLAEALAHVPLKSAIGLVTDSHVAPLYGDRVAKFVQDLGYRCITHVMPAGEANKKLAEIENICGTLLEGGLDRSSVLIALGGGVVGDLAGFAAACFMRGIPYIQIPTTIVAQVDSSVGGKTGVNHALGKNTIGAFHQPQAVIIDLGFLRSLPERELRAGLAEVIKHGVIADAELFEYMEQNSAAILAKDLAALRYPVQRSCEIKSAIVAEDEFETGVRANLNYGHTFGHAFEAVTQYTHFLHGEAIALGMCAAAELSRSLGLIDDATVSRQRACIEQYGLPTRWPELPVEDCIVAMRKDKKVRAGTMKFIVAEAIGRAAQRTDVTEAQARLAMQAIKG